MASNALEEKINKIKLQNEEIRRRHEEVEADKKNAAKLNALVKMVPSDDWPERKEPPEFSAPSKNFQKQKVVNKEYNDRAPQLYSGIHERLGKKDHKFAQGDGPPPDPKYNFLADSEREVCVADNGRVEENKNRFRNKSLRVPSKKRGGDGGSRDAYFKDNRGPYAFYSKEEALPEYEAWRAERNRIDEARINRQKTAEGNWRREWDSNKINVEKDSLKKGDSNRKDSSNYERKNNHYDSEYNNRGHGGSRTYHGSQKNHNQDYRRSHNDQVHEFKRQLDNKPPLSPTDDRTITSNDKSIKITLNYGNQTKGPVMSVKVNSPSIAGTGRVGPRQKSRVTYSSQLDADIIHELGNFSRQKSFDEKTAGAYFSNGQKLVPKSPFSQRKKDGNSKSPYAQRKEFKNDESSTRSKINLKTPYLQRNEVKDQKPLNNSNSKVQRIQKRTQKSVLNKEDSSISDEAIPSEYNPDKSFSNREDLVKENIEKCLNETNEVDKEYSNKSINQNNHNDCPENTDYENVGNIKNDQISNSNSHIEINENIKNVKTTVDVEHFEIDKIEDKEIDTNMESIEINKNIMDIVDNKYSENDDDNAGELYKNIENDKESIIIPNIILIDTTKNTNNENSSPDFDVCVDIIEEKPDLCMFTQKNETQDIINEHNQILSLELMKEGKVINNYENGEIQTIELEQGNNQSKKINDLTSNVVKCIENSLTKTNVIQNELIDCNDFKDNSFMNESTEYTERKSALVDSPKKSPNDSGFIDDFDKHQTNCDASIIKCISENDFEKDSEQSVIFNTIELTKEIHDKCVEFCDTSSAASNKIPQVIEDYSENTESEIDIQDVILDGHAKDNEVCFVEEIKSSERIEHIDINKLRQNESIEEESPGTEGTVKVKLEEATIVVSKESTNIISDEPIKILSSELKEA